MHQRLHLLVVDRERRAALAARYGTRWLLPSLECGEMMRAGPLVARWCAERGLMADVAGQWLGRVDENGIDWLMAVAARDGPPHEGTVLEWLSLGALAGSKSVIDYQSWAVERSLENQAVPNVRGPFGTLDWPDRTRAWMRDRLKFTPDAWTTYRAGAYEIVLGMETPRGRVYVKGLAPDRMSEPIVTGRFVAIAPDSFARTIALDRQEDGTAWWATAECPGRPAADLIAVAVALARLQYRLRILARHAPELEQLDSPAAARAGMPESWVPMDLDRSNVLCDGDRVSFIDLEDSCFGPAPLAMAAFARRCGAGDPAYRAYERSWSPSLGRLDWGSLEDEAVSFQMRRGWTRLLRNVARGELHADLDVLRTRIRARLARALHRG